MLSATSYFNMHCDSALLLLPYPNSLNKLNIKYTPLMWTEGELVSDLDSPLPQTCLSLHTGDASAEDTKPANIMIMSLHATSRKHAALYTGLACYLPPLFENRTYEDSGTGSSGWNVPVPPVTITKQHCQNAEGTQEHWPNYWHSSILSSFTTGPLMDRHCSFCSWCQYLYFNVCHKVTSAYNKTHGKE